MAQWTFNATSLEASTGAPGCAHAIDAATDASDALAFVGPPPPPALEPVVATCRYNRTFKVNRGRAGKVSLDYRPVHVDPLTPESEGGISLKKIAPKARVY